MPIASWNMINVFLITVQRQFQRKSKMNIPHDHSIRRWYRQFKTPGKIPKCKSRPSIPLERGMYYRKNFYIV